MNLNSIIVGLTSVLSSEAMFANNLQSFERPNIIIILADDLGYGDIGGYYGGKPDTPNLNQLACEGMVFTDFHSNGVVCSPTRASLLTGRYPQRLGIETAQKEGLDMERNRNEITMAEYLKGSGYATGIVGKWHLGQPPAGNPINFGFDEFVGYFGGCLDYFSKVSRSGHNDWWFNDKLFAETGYVTDLIADHSCSFIERNKENPFFLYISHLAVHFPFQEPGDNSNWRREEGREYLSEFPGPDSKLGPHNPDEVPLVLSKMIEDLDKSIGRVMETLEYLGLDKKTFVFFTSDNGNYLSYNSGMWPNIGSNGILRGQKGDLYEGGHRVPAIAWWPEVIPELSACDEFTCTFDILPTVLEMLEIQTPLNRRDNKIDGKSLMPLFRNTGKLPTRSVFWRNQSQNAVRSGEWKMIVSKKTGQIELFNLNRDVREVENVAMKFPEILGKLRNEIDVWNKDVDFK